MYSEKAVDEFLDSLWEKCGLRDWITQDEAKYLAEEAERMESGVYMEIGVAYGMSLMVVGQFAKPEVEIYGIDIQNWDLRKDNLEKMGFSERVNFIHGDSQEEAILWRKPIDLLFIDGDHRYEGTVADLLSWIPHVKAGGRVIMHDYKEENLDIFKAVNRFVANHRAYSDFQVHDKMYSFRKEHRYD